LAADQSIDSIRASDFGASDSNLDRALRLRRSRPIQKPPLEPSVVDIAPSGPVLTGYDEQHLVTYLRLLDAEIDGADWREVAKVVLKIDPDSQPQRARRVWESHLTRARWISKSGFKHLLRGGAPLHAQPVGVDRTSAGQAFQHSNMTVRIAVASSGAASLRLPSPQVGKNPSEALGWSVRSL
jgi:Uncharacterized conserved protein (DUF2285)